jgi:hypothetical protein
MVGLFWVGKKEDRPRVLLACIDRGLDCIDLSLARDASKKGNIVAKQNCDGATQTRADSLSSCDALPLPRAGTLEGNNRAMQTSNSASLACSRTM